MPHYTPEQYLAMEETAEYKSEYYQGEIFVMAGGSVNHNRIAGNIYFLLRLALRGKPCQSFIGDVRLLVEQNGLYTYPDVMVVCGGIDYVIGRTDTITNPLVIFEVLSDSTANYDRTTKFGLYRALDSLRAYVMVDQARPYVEYFERLDNRRWVLETYTSLEEVLRIPAIEAEFEIAQIYDRVEFESEQTQQEENKNDATHDV